jgi:hypothetical protein
MIGCFMGIEVYGCICILYVILLNITCMDQLWRVWLGDWLHPESADPEWIHSSQDWMVLSLCLVREMR